MTLTLKPYIYKAKGKWWIRCGHPNLTGPYDEFMYAAVVAGLVWFEREYL